MLEYFRALLGPTVSKSEPSPQVIYVSAERAAVEMRKAWQLVNQEVAVKNHFVQWATGKIGWPGPEALFAEAMAKGRASISGYYHGSIWVKDEELLALFTRAAKMAGFKTEFHISDSEGPEADTFYLTVMPTS